VEAKRVNVEKAEKIARSYARTSPRLVKRENFRLSKTVSRRVTRKQPAMRRAAQPQDEPMFYVFSMNGDSGFILVAGDDVAKPVLGYSDTGTYDENNPNIVYWMETLSQEITDAIENNVPQDELTKAAWEAFATDNDIQPQSVDDYVEPLIKTKWNQSPPYNDWCPEISGERAPTGCVATAMAQIMKYHEYPTTRTVEIPGYTTSRTNIPPITGSTTYRWNNMSNTYSTSSTDESKTAIAELMYHCGVSVEMDYNVNESAASSSNVVTALKTYYGYDAGILYLYRNRYSYTEWIDLLKTELKANRPIYYSGSSDKGGHAFVCDGYNADNLFHFNWGWGGSSDGYFEVSALNPSSVGIGGGSSGYNQGQTIIAGIQPDTGEQPVVLLRIGLSSVVSNKSLLNSLTESFNVSAIDLTNLGSEPLTEVYLGVLLCRQDGSYYDHKTILHTFNRLNPGSWYSSYTLLSEYLLPPDLPAGTYKLYPAFSASSERPSVIFGSNGDKYIVVDVKTDGSVTLTESSNKPNLSLTSLQSLRTVYQNKTGYFTAEITNSGTTDYNSKLTLKLGSQTVVTDPVVIPAGITKTVGFSGTITLKSGDYTLSILYDTENTPDGSPSAQLGNSVPIVVKAEPVEEPNLSLVSAISFPDETAVNMNNPYLTIKIENKGGLYDGRINVFIYPESDGSSIGSFGTQNLWLEKDEEQEILFNNPITFLSPGTYRGCIFYFNKNIWEQLDYAVLFTVVVPPPVVNAQPPIITAQPQSAEYTVNTAANAISVTANVSDGGTLSYQWHSNTSNNNTGGSVISGATSTSYTPSTTTVGTTYYYVVVNNTNNDVNGQSTATIASNTAAITVKKISPSAPDAPVLADKTATSITLNTIEGDVEYSIDGETWQDSPTFNSLIPNTAYIFYARYKETDTQTISPVSSPSGTITTDKTALSGEVTVSGDVIFGKTLTAVTSALTSSSELGLLSYQWKRDNVVITGAINVTYTLVQADIAATITVTVTTSNTSGSLTSNPTVAVAKAKQDAPDAPILADKTATSITLNTIEGDVEYSIDGETWQDSPTFDNLNPDTEYTFYARLKKSDTHNASPTSEGTSVRTHTDKDANLVSLIVNGKPLSVSDEELYYQATCNETSLMLDVKPSPFASVNLTVDKREYGNNYNIPLSGDKNIINIQIVSGDKQKKANYKLTVANPLKADSVLFQRWSDVIAVNLNPKTNGGYSNIDSVCWRTVDNPNIISREWYIQITGNVTEYHAEVRIAGNWHKVCGIPEINTNKILVYPNPVIIGENLNLLLPDMFKGGYMNVINLAGAMVKQKLPLSNMTNSISVADWTPGIYLLNIVAPNGDRETVKVVVSN
jgi:hypothetical protein